VKWLEAEGEKSGGSGGGSEELQRLRAVREGLDLASGRTDELALRRVWGRLADFPMPRSHRARPFWLGGALLLMAGVAATGFAMSLRIAELSPRPTPVAQLAVPPVPPLDLEGVPILLGPATLQTGATEVKRVRLKGGALIGVAADTTLNVDAGQRPSIARGRIDLEVPHQPPGEQFTVEAGPYMIVVVGTKFGVALSSRQVEVSVTEGVVEVWRDGKVVRLTAGRSFQGPLTATAPSRSAVRLDRPRRSRLALAMPTRHPSDKFDQAKLALATGDAVAGLEILRDLAAGTGPIAENSGYEVGVVLRDRLDQPREAIAAWKRYRERFPRGLLRAEADLSIVETHLELREVQAARAEAEAFLRRYPRSERRAELNALVQRLDMGTGDVMAEKPHSLGALDTEDKLVERAQ
jgi:hypothetical protein